MSVLRAIRGAIYGPWLWFCLLLCLWCTTLRILSASWERMDSSVITKKRCIIYYIYLRPILLILALDSMLLLVLVYSIIHSWWNRKVKRKKIWGKRLALKKKPSDTLMLHSPQRLFLLELVVHLYLARLITKKLQYNQNNLFVTNLNTYHPTRNQNKGCHSDTTIITNTMTILYALVSRQQTVLAENTTDSGKC